MIPKTAYGRIVRHRRARHDAHTRHTTPETHEKPARNALETHANSYSGGQGPASLQRKKGAEAPERPRVALLLGPQSADRSVMHAKRPGDIS
jgi:hypothetical protein